MTRRWLCGACGAEIPSGALLKACPEYGAIGTLTIVSPKRV